MVAIKLSAPPGMKWSDLHENLYANSKISGKMVCYHRTNRTVGDGPLLFVTYHLVLVISSVGKFNSSSLNFDTDTLTK